MSNVARPDSTKPAHTFTGEWKNICDKVRGGNPVEADANAHLIAAAPELYAALKLIVDHYGDPLKVARPALQKAEGR